AGGAEAALAAVGAGKALDRDEAGSAHRHHDELCDAVARRDAVALAGVGVEQGHSDLAAVARVDGARAVDDRDAVFGGETAAGHHEGDISIGQSDRDARADCRALAGSQHDVGGRHEVGTGIAGVRVGGRHIGAQQYLDGLGHSTRVVHGRMDPMIYRERLWPAPWIFLSTALVIPASLLVFLPISTTAGWIVAVVLYGLIVATLLVTTPTVEVADGELRAGRARLPLAVVGGVRAAHGADAVHERGVGLHADAWLLIRGWIPDVVRVELDDPQDPTPYWIISSRRADALAAAIAGAVD